MFIPQLKGWVTIRDCRKEVSVVWILWPHSPEAQHFGRAVFEHRVCLGSIRDRYQHQKMQQGLERSRRQSEWMCVAKRSELNHPWMGKKEYSLQCYPLGNQRNEENLSLSSVQLLVLVCCTFHSFVITPMSQSGIVFCLSREHSLKLFWVHNTLVLFLRPVLDWILADYTSVECSLSCLTSWFILYHLFFL